MTNVSSSNLESRVSMEKLFTTLENLPHQHNLLQGSVFTLQENQHYPQPDDNVLEDLNNPQPLTGEIWDDHILDNFKSPPIGHI